MDTKQPIDGISHSGRLIKKYALLMISLCGVIAAALTTSILINVNQTLDGIKWTASKSFVRQIDNQQTKTLHQMVEFTSATIRTDLQMGMTPTDIAQHLQATLVSIDWIARASLYDRNGNLLMYMKNTQHPPVFTDFTATSIRQFNTTAMTVDSDEHQIEAVNVIQLNKWEKLVLHIGMDKTAISGALSDPTSLFDQITNFALQEQIKDALKITLLFIGVSACLAIAFAFRMAAPIKKLAQSMRAAGSGDLTVRAETTGADEIVDLAVVFNSMTSQLQAQQDKLAEQVSELSAANFKTQRANVAMRDLLSRVSHELRTPMNAILGFAQIVRDDVDEPLSFSQRDSVNEIIEASNHLLALINEILKLSQLDSGTVIMEKEPISVLKIVHSSISMVTPQALEAHISITNEISTDKLYVTADKQRLREVFINVLSNAVKYNKKGGNVLIRAIPIDNEYVDIEFHDTGRGIPEDKISDMFQAFNRLDADTTGIEGTGIGLSITQKLVEEMDGAIKVSSKVGVGTTVTIRMVRYLRDLAYD